MFKLLSKEQNIFSIPTYISFLLLGLIVFNVLKFNEISVLSSIVVLIGMALGYFAINSLDLNQNTRVPLFLYTIINICLYQNTDIGVAWTVLTNAILVILLSNGSESRNKHIYVLIGALLALNFIFLPTIWLMPIFFILHIFGTSKNITLNIFRLCLGVTLVAIAYFSVAYFSGLNTWDTAYLPCITSEYSGVGERLIPLVPVVLFCIYAIFDYFARYNKMSTHKRFKYAFLLLFVFVQLMMIVFYMGEDVSYLLIIALPVSIIISRALYYLPKPMYKEISIWLIVISLIAYRAYQFINF